MGLSDEAKIAKEAEDVAKGHPQQVDEAVKEGEKFAQDRTDHRHDQQITEGGEQLEKHLGAGQQDQQGQQPQPSGRDAGSAQSGS